MTNTQNNADMIYSILGKNMREVREFLDLTQEELSIRTNQGRASIANIEAGRQTVALHQVDDIANALGIKPSRLFKGMKGFCNGE